MDVPGVYSATPVNLVRRINNLVQCTGATSRIIINDCHKGFVISYNPEGIYANQISR